MTSRNAQPPTMKGRILFAESRMLVICTVAIPKSAATLSYYDDSVNGPEALVVLVPVGAILVPAHPYFPAAFHFEVSLSIITS